MKFTLIHYTTYDNIFSKDAFVDSIGKPIHFKDNDSIKGFLTAADVSDDGCYVEFTIEIPDHDSVSEALINKIRIT